MTKIDFTISLRTFVLLVALASVGVAVIAQALVRWVG